MSEKTEKKKTKKTKKVVKPKTKKSQKSKKPKKVKVNITIPHTFHGKEYKAGIVKVEPKEAKRLLRYFAKEV